METRLNHEVTKGKLQRKVHLKKSRAEKAEVATDKGSRRNNDKLARKPENEVGHLEWRPGTPTWRR